MKNKPNEPTEGENNMNKIKTSHINQTGKQIRSFEQKFVGSFGVVFELPYNIGIAALTIAMWLGSFAFSYSSTGNFNLFPTIVSYMVFASLFGITYGSIAVRKSGDLLTKIEAVTITKLGVLSVILNIFMLMGVKIFAFQQIGLYVISPLAIFSFLLMLKQVWKNSER